ncbi:MAG: methyltransferase domain-containing protein [Opitutales bacterium]|nr:methyltransferase domain-containing protein [Opitutales bacterium]
MPDDCESIEFWNQRYRDQKMAWDYGGVPPDLTNFLAEQPGSNASVLIPGCGSGYEIAAFRNAGYKVKAIEISPEAIVRARSTIGETASRCIEQGDFFEMNLPRGSVQIVYERTFHCALHPRRRPDYLQSMANWIEPGGYLLGFFLYGSESEPPPYPMDPSLRETAFLPYFSLKNSRLSQRPIPMHQNMEYWQVWQRKG